MQVELGNIIARRELHLDDAPAVIVEIGAPFAPADYPDEYWCPYRIRGVGRGRIRRTVGIDAVQALLLALQTIGADLYSSREYETGALSWFPGDRIRDLGFPVADILRDLLPPSIGNRDE